MLRKTYNSALRSSKSDRFNAALLTSARAARYAYFPAIKKAIRDHLSSFLASASPRTGWTTKRFAVGRSTPVSPSSKEPRHDLSSTRHSWTIFSPAN